MKYILITGVSTGIGYGAAQAFLEKGYQVLGSVRKQSDAEKLQQELGKNFTALLFDVTDHDAIAAAAKKVESIVGKDGLACLINNAGLSTSGPLMLQPLADFRHQFEVNLFGLLAVTQAFLPLLGAKENPGHAPGKIVNISSVGGKLAAPFLGAYSSSKHALEGLSSAMRTELQLFGIDVIIVGPGAIKTPIWDKASANDLGIYAGTAYAPMMQKFQRYFVGNARARGLSQEVMGKKLVQIFEKRKPKARYAVVPNWLKDWIIPTKMPARMLDRIMGKATGLLKKS